MSTDPHVVFGDGMTFVRRCARCGRFVRAHKRVRVDGQGQPVAPNAVCDKCGRTHMLFVGYY